MLRILEIIKDKAVGSLTELEKPPERQVTLAQAEEVARHIRELLVVQGWCLWKCTTLGGDIIAVVRNESVKGIPDGYLVYTEAELDELCQDGVSEATLRLVHEAKKTAGAKVVSEDEGG